MRTLGVVVLGGCLLVGTSCGDDGPPAAVNSSTTSSSDSSSTASGGSGSSSGADTTEGDLSVCGTSTATALAQCVDVEAIEQDVTFMAEIRTPGSPHWLAVQEFCVDRLTMLGYDVELHEYNSGVNVIGRLPGTETSDEIVLVGAHYDHIPNCLGADDNATGVAAPPPTHGRARSRSPVGTRRSSVSSVPRHGSSKGRSRGRRSSRTSTTT